MPVAVEDDVISVFTCTPVLLRIFEGWTKAVLLPSRTVLERRRCDCHTIMVMRSRTNDAVLVVDGDDRMVVWSGYRWW
jgi:hypothetical protein